MPPDSQESFLILKLLKIKSDEKTTLEKVTKLVPLPEKISEYALDMKHFQRAYLRFRV